MRKPTLPPVFHSVSIEFYRFANWGIGGESTHKSATFFSCTSLFGATDVQILNRPDSFDVVGILGHAGESARIVDFV